jgi:hypothetical protein
MQWPPDITNLNFYNSNRWSTLASFWILSHAAAGVLMLEWANMDNPKTVFAHGYLFCG